MFNFCLFSAMKQFEVPVLEEQEREHFDLDDNFKDLHFNYPYENEH